MSEAYKEFLVSNLLNEPSKVAVSGVVVSKQDNGFLLDDGTGQLVVSLENFEFSEGSYIRAFGQLVPFEEGKELQAFFVQDISSMDKEVHRKVLEGLQ
tara:strand:+ start:542 stop:835 length:294 start_codon:yes stop_codon:yes gene_type:complete